MRVLILDLDTLRADHLGCYGYKRNTSPNIDSVAKEGVVFENYYCPNAPCLPSRASLISGKFGVATGIVGHGGTAADMRIEGENRGFVSDFHKGSLFQQFRRAGYYTASVSTFAERHSAFWFYSGLNEIFNQGEGGMESGEDVLPYAADWIEKHGGKEDWMLHINFWDAHTPYRAPLEYGNPFENEPLSDDWIDEKEFEKHLSHIGPHGANEINMWNDNTNAKYPRHIGKLTSLKDVKSFVDNYDTGIKYMDEKIGEIFNLLKKKGLYDDNLCIIITADHGENMGELGIYGEHATADQPCCRIPMIIKWKGGKKGLYDNGIHTNVDLLPTVCDLLNIKPLADYDGQSYAPTLLRGEDCGQKYAVLSQCAHVCQRSVRFGDYLYIRTYHGGGHIFNKEMLFDIKQDPYEKNDLAEKEKDLCAKGFKLIKQWEEKILTKHNVTDPMLTVLKEKGPFHSRGQLENYAKRLMSKGRNNDAKKLIRKYKLKIEGK